MGIPLEEFVRRIERSGVIPVADVHQLLSASPELKEADKLARELVKRGKLSAYQAQVIYKGQGAGLVMGNYEILDKIGQGGMGMVLKARHKRMQRIVALKVLAPNVVKSPDLLERFHREVFAAARLNHPNVVAAYDADEVRGTHFLVLEYVEGTDLSALVKRQGPLSVSQAIDCVLQAAKGLQYAHEQGIVHRDIKPGNLLLDGNQTVKILDMGLARIDAADGKQQAELTSTGAVMGTIDYMAPEQALSTKSADARSDIYSLGITLWYLLVGHPAYDGESLMARLLAHREAPIPSLVAARGDVSPELDAIFQKMVAKAPADRYQTMTDVVAVLQAVQSGTSTTLRVAQVRSETNRLDDFLNSLGSDSSPSSPTMMQATRQLTKRRTDSTSDATLMSANASQTTDPVTLTAAGITKYLAAKSRLDWTKPRTRWIAAGSLAAIVLLSGLVIGIRTKDGRTTAITPPEGAPGEIVEVVRAKDRLSTSATSSLFPVTASPAVSSRPLLEGARQILVNPGEPLYQHSLVSQPPAIEGLRSWTIELSGWHYRMVSSMEWHPSGEWFVTQDETGTLRVWNPQGGLLQVIPCNGRGAWQGHSFTLADEGRLLAAISFRGPDRTLRVWDTSTWACIRTIPYPRGFEANAISWSAANRRLAIAGSPGVFVVDPVTGQTAEQSLQGQCNALAFSPDGTTIAIGSDSGKLIWVDAETLETLHEETSVHPANGRPFPIKGVAFSPDGRLLASSGRDGAVRLWDAVTAESRGSLPIGVSGTYHLQWFRDSRRLAVSGEGGPMISVWDITRPEGPLVKSGHGACFGFALAPTEKEIVYATAWKELHSFDVDISTTRRLDTRVGIVGVGVNSVLSPQGDRIAEQFQGALTIRDSETGHPLKQLGKIPDGGVTWSPDGRRILLSHSRGPDKNLLILDPETGRSTALSGHSRVWSVCWSPDNTQVASAGEGTEVLVHNADTGELIRKCDVGSISVNTLAWSPDGKSLAAIDNNGKIGLWDPATGQKQGVSTPNVSIRFPPGSRRLAWMPDSRRLWIILGGSVARWDSQTNQLSPQEQFSTGASLAHIALSPQGTHLLIGEGNNGSFIRGETPQDRHFLGDFGIWVDAHADNRRCLWRIGGPTAIRRAYDLKTSQPLGTLMTHLIGDAWIVIGPDGHHRGGQVPPPGLPAGDGTTPEETASIEHHIVYVAQHNDGRHQTYTPAEFREKFGWRNDPRRATLMAIP